MRSKQCKNLLLKSALVAVLLTDIGQSFAAKCQCDEVYNANQFQSARYIMTSFGQAVCCYFSGMPKPAYCIETADDLALPNPPWVTHVPDHAFCSENSSKCHFEAPNCTRHPIAVETPPISKSAHPVSTKLIHFF